MTLAYAQKCADRLIERLTPFCERIELAGSIRRQRPQCGDIDLVVTPKTEILTDMLGQETGRRNYCAEAIANWAKAEGWSLDKNGPACLIFTAKGVQADIWFTVPECFGTVWLCRTGSKEHNILLAKRALDLGGRWDSHHGVRLGGKQHAAATEHDVYRALGLPFIAPEYREHSEVLRIIIGATAR